MADAQANINLNLNTSGALAQLRALQRQISLFQQQMARGNANTVAQAQGMQRNLLNTINSTGQFSASMTTVSTATESFTSALQKNKLSMGEYFRFAGGSSKNFGRLFKNEMNLVGKVARERVKDLQTQYIKMGRDSSGAMKAMAVRPLTLDMENLATKTAMAAQKQQIFNQLIRQGSTNLLNWGKNTQWAGRQLMVGFTLPLGIMGATAISEFRKIEEQVVKFKRVYGDMFTTSAETEKALDNIRELADEFTKYGIAVEKTIDLAAKVAQMGNMGDALEAQVTQATRLAVLGGLEQQEALDTTISLTNAFGVATEDLADKISFLNAAENQTILAIEDFNEAIPKAGSVVQQLGGDVEDLAFFLTAMREGGINASQGANALKSSLGRLVNPTETAKQKMGELGIDIVGIVENNVGDLRSTIMELGYELDALAPLDRSRAIEQMFGKFQFARMSTMFQNIVKDGSQAQKVLELTTNSSEELGILAERELARVEESPAFKLQKSFEKLKASLAPLGEQFVEIITPIIEFGTNILEKFNAMGEGGKRFATITVAALGLVAPAALMIIGLIANGVANLSKFFTMLMNVGKRGSTSMTQLGAQTQYMTQEQIEANAIAASLNNSHERLRQTFTSEAAAVRNLTTAYQQGVGAQRAFAFGPTRTAGGVARTRPVAGYAEGVISVPGPKGAGDIIPAMLSPGEAVIPRDMVTKYSPLIEGMIAGNLPGYEDGGVIKAGHVVFGNEMLYSEASMMAPGNQSAAGVDMNWLRRGGSDVASSLEGALLADPDDFAMAGEKLGPVADKLTENLAEAAGGTEDFASAGKKSYKQMLETIDEQKNLGNITAEEAKGLKKRVRKLFKPTMADRREIRRSRADLGVDERGRVVQRRQIPSTVEGGAYRKATRRATETARARRGMSALPSGYQAAHPSQPVASKNTPAPRVSSTVPAAAVPVVTAAAVSATAAGDKGLKEHLNAQQQSTKQTKKQTSETKKNTRETTKNTGAKTKNTKSTKNNTKKSESHQKGWATRRRNESLSRVNTMTSRAPIIAPLPMDASGNAIPQTTGAGPGKFSRFMSVGKGSGGMGIAMAGSALAMGGSMLPGKAGETAQKLMPAIMGISMLAPMIGMLGGPVSALIAVVGGAVTSMIMLNKKFDNSRDKAYEMGRALGASSDAMESLAKFAGTVSSSQLMDRVRKERMTGVTTAPGKTTFGESFVQDEAGQALIDASKQSIAQTGSSQAAIGQLTSQLSTAIISGILTKEQAQSIAGNVAFALNDMQIGFEVRANIAQLVGPNGEDISGGDIVEMSARLNQDSLSQIDTQVDSLNKNIADMPFGTQTQRNVGIGGMTAAGAGVGAGIGTLIAPGIGSLIGAGLGAIGGAVGGYFAMKDQAEEAGRLAGATVATITNALDQQQELSDALDAYYYKKIQEAKVQGDITKQLALQAEYEGKKAEMSEQEMAMREQMRGALEGPGADAARSGIEAAIATRFKDDADAQLLLPGIEATMNRLDLSDAETDMINLELATGALEPAAVNSLLNFIGESGSQKTALIDIVGKFGGVFAQEASQIMNLVEDEDLAASIFVDVSKAGNEQDAQEILDFVREIQKQDGVFDTDVILRYTQENESIAQELESIFERADLGVATVEQAYQINPKLENPEAFDEVYFESLSDGDKEQYVKTISTILAMEPTQIVGDPGFLLWLQESGNSLPSDGGGFSIPKLQDMYGQAMGFKVTQELSTVDSTTGGEEEEVASGGGSAKKLTSIMDDLVKKLRDVRLNQIVMTNGWVESANKLEELFGGGRGMSVFSGLEQDMRRLGAGEDLIDLIAGMDPEEFEKKKDQLFTFDAAGNITGATNILANMGKALNAIALGDFQSEQEKVIRTTNNQIIATRKLVAAGLSQAAAYEAVQDAAFAAAIAQEKNTKVIKQLVRVTKEAKEMTEAFAAAQAVASSNQDFVDRGKAIDFIAKNMENLTEAQKQLIMNDSNVQALIGTTVDAKALRQALANAEKDAELELKIKKLTFEGQIDIFEEGFSNAMEAFTVQEKEIELDFKIKKQPLIDAIEAAEQQIQDIRDRPGGLDDLEADLQRISSKEEEVNEKYDNRIEALEEVKSIQQAISKLQESQLSVAEALSVGDIAAAARAAQQARQSAASRAMETQKKQIEIQRENELGQLTAESGMTREQIEENVKSLKDQIFEIEEKTLEPAQYRLTLLEREQQELVDGLTVLGKTRDEWERVKNNVDLAKISTDEFQQSMREALDIVDDIVNYWNDFDPEPKEIEIREVRVKDPEELESSLDVVPTETNDDPGNGIPEQDTPKELPDDFGTGSLLINPNAPNNPYGLTPKMNQMFSDYYIRTRPQNVRQADGSFPEEEAGRIRRSRSFDVLGGVPEGYYQNPGTGPDLFGDPSLAFTEYEKNLLENDSNASQAEQNNQVNFGRTDLPQSSRVLPGGGPGGAPAALTGEQGFDSVVPKITEGLGAKLQQIKNDTAETTRVMLQHFGQFGITAPILMQTIPNFINKIPEQSRIAILEGVQGHFNTLSINAKQTLAQIPDFFTRLPEVSQEALLEQMNSQFGQFSTQALTDLGGINDWILALPEDAQASAWDVLSQQISKLALDSEGNLNETILKFFDVLPENVQAPLVEELGAHIKTMAENAGMDVDQYITTKLKDLPAETKEMLVDGIQGNITEASEGSAEAITTYIPGGLREVTDSSSETASGMEKDFETASLSAVEDVQTIKTPFEALAAYISDDGEEGFTGILNKAFEDAKDNGVSAAGDIETAFGEAGKKFASEFKNKFSDLIDQLVGVRIDGDKIEIDRNGFNKGGLVPGIGNTDIVPASLTPGEFVITKFATRNFGVENLQSINDGKFPVAAVESSSSGDIRYNNSYQINVNVKSESNPENIARTVVQSIKRVDSQRIRGNRL